MGVLTVISALIVLSLLTACYQCSKETGAVNVFATCVGSKVNPATVLEEVVGASEIECARACKNNKYCRSTNFIRNEICQLLYETVECNQLPLDKNYKVFHQISSSEDNAGRRCQFDQPFNVATKQCQCADGFIGDYCEQPPRDCSDFSTNGFKDIYLINTDEKVAVRCWNQFLYILNFESDANAFTDYMHSGWNTFKAGFNTFTSKRFWIGNDNVHAITSTGRKYKLETVSLIDNSYRSQRYHSFRMDDEMNNYTIHFSGTDNHTEESTFFDNVQFQAPDFNSNQCTAKFNSAWWYPDNCTLPSLFTGQYPSDNQLKFTPYLVFRLKRN